MVYVCTDVNIKKAAGSGNIMRAIHTCTSASPTDFNLYSNTQQCAFQLFSSNFGAYELLIQNYSQNQ